jgi:tRNA-2-methylthio-N6-dimethylallyladenosine synthase
MNERDSEEVLGMLTAQGYEIAQQPEGADVILLNTCSVRQHAEDRAMGKMFELAEMKVQRPDLVLGFIGCMAKLQQDHLFKRIPGLDLVAGPAELYDLPYLLAEIQEKRQRGHLNGQARVMAVGREFRPLEAKPAGDFRKPGVRAFVTIMEGCDKACTYCIVPKTRGQEVSRPAEEILQEINTLHRAGYQEVILLGQNVNSYGKRFPDGSGYMGPLGRLRLLEQDADALLDFPQLLRSIDASLQGPHLGGWRGAGVPRRPQPTTPIVRRGEDGGGGTATGPAQVRIRFTTSHPFDANERLFRAMAECRSVCEWLHLPAQSGSNRILRAMRRGYTVEHYLTKIEQLRRLVPTISLSTDIIVGFPGETEEDVEATARLLREVRYDSAYLFKYSPRPGTEAAAREDDVPHEVKEARHQELLALQGHIEAQRAKALEGQVMEILVEEPGKFGGQWFGRTRGNHGVVVASPARLAGQLVPVRMTRAVAHTLFGEVHG